MWRPMTVALALLVGWPAFAADEAEQRVRQLVDVWASGDVSALDDLMTADVVYDDVPNSHRFEGVEGGASPRTVNI